MSTGLKVTLVAVIALLVAGWADAPLTQTKPEYRVVCVNPEVDDRCEILNSNDIKVDEVNFEIASENNMMSDESQVKLWVEGKK
jgi:hypothetical protein